MHSFLNNHTQASHKRNFSLHSHTILASSSAEMNWGTLCSVHLPSITDCGVWLDLKPPRKTCRTPSELPVLSLCYLDCRNKTMPEPRLRFQSGFTMIYQVTVVFPRLLLPCFHPFLFWPLHGFTAALFTSRFLCLLLLLWSPSFWCHTSPRVRWDISVLQSLGGREQSAKALPKKTGRDTSSQHIYKVCLGGVLLKISGWILLIRKPHYQVI